MQEPSLRQSRLTLAGVLIAVALVGGGGFLIGRGTDERAPADPAPAPVVVPVAVPAAAPTTGNERSRILRRGDLIALAALASDATAAGTGVPDEIGEADGRRFVLNLPFGCDGPAPAGSEAPMRWRYDAEARTLRISVTPVTWNPGDWSADAGDSGGPVEGYWLPRPWTASEACPPARQQTNAIGEEPVLLPGQTLAVAQFFDPASARQAERGNRPYESVLRVAPDAVRAERGFHLRLEGRIARTPAGTPVSCRQPAGAEQRPICVIAVAIDEVAIVNPATEETLATWTTEQPNAR